MALAARPKPPRAVTSKPVRNGPADANIKAKARSCRSDGSRKEFRQIDGEATENAVVKEAQHWQQDQDLGKRPRDQERKRQHAQAPQAHEPKNWPPTKPFCQWTETEITHQRAAIEGHRGIADI